jgi:hypothetical protein
MRKLNRPETMVLVRAMPNSKENDFCPYGRQVASHRLPDAPLAVVPQTPLPAKPKKSEAERAQPSKASLVQAARRRGLKGCTQMSREALARALAH